MQHTTAHEHRHTAKECTEKASEDAITFPYQKGIRSASPSRLQSELTKSQDLKGSKSHEFGEQNMVEHVCASKTPELAGANETQWTYGAPQVWVR